MPSYYDDAVASIRRLLGYDAPAASPPPAPSRAKGKPGGAARAAVEANDSQRLLEAAQARRIGLMDDPAEAGQDTFRARDAAGPIVAAAGAGAAMGLTGAVADKVKKSYGPPTGMTSTGGAADLAEEYRPAPVVQPTGTEFPPSDPNAEAAFTDQFKRQYTARENKRQAQGAGTYPKPPMDPRAEAERLMKDLNARRMAAKGEVADGRQTEARINDLIAQSNKMRNSQTPQQAQATAAANPQDYHAQARAMLADLNERASRMGGTPPDMQKVLAEVRRLNALGDEQRNARTTARR